MKTLATGLLAAALTPALVSAAPEEITCPHSLPQAALMLREPPAGWQFYAQSPLYLHSAEPMSTPPEKLGHLIHTSIRKRKDEEVYIYQLEGNFNEGKWLQCAYGENNQLTLSRRLADETRSCAVSYRKAEKAGEKRIKISCE